MQDKLYNSYLTINIKRLIDNVKSVQRGLKNDVEIIAVLKSDAYNLGVTEIANALYKYTSIKTFAIAQVIEGVQLRENGLKDCNIHVLGGVPEDLFEYVVQYDLQMSIFHPSTAYKLNEIAKSQGKIAKIQIKIETGLNRIGVNVGDDLEKLIEAIKMCENLEVYGVFSHFANGEIEHHPMCYSQYEVFKKALAQLEKAEINPPQKHICNSGGSDWFFDAHCTAIRLGRRLYMDSQQHPLEKGTDGAVEEICTWTSKITNISNVLAGQSIGYGEKCVVDRPSKIAVMCVGYADGISPEYVAKHVPVLIGSQKAPIIATCMDQSFIDVTDIKCNVGDKVTIFGQNEQGYELTIQQLGDHVGVEGVAFFSHLSNRVKRIYLK